MTQTLLLLSEGQRTIPRFGHLFPKPANVAKAIAIPTAAIPYENYRQKDWFMHERVAFQALGLQLTDFDLTGKTQAEVAAALQDADIIYVNGGNTYFLMEKINQSGFAAVLKDRLRAGALYVGSSAGAVVACPDISFIETMDEPEAASLTDFSGMGLIDFSILPHFDHPQYGTIAKEIAARAEPSARMIGLRDDQAIVVRGSYVEVF